MTLGGLAMNGPGVARARPALFVGSGATHQASDKPSEGARAIEDVPDKLVWPAHEPGERPALDRRAHERQVEEGSGNRSKLGSSGPRSLW